MNIDHQSRSNIRVSGTSDASFHPIVGCSLFLEPKPPFTTPISCGLDHVQGNKSLLNCFQERVCFPFCETGLEDIVAAIGWGWSVRRHPVGRLQLQRGWFCSGLACAGTKWAVYWFWNLIFNFLVSFLVHHRTAGLVCFTHVQASQLINTNRPSSVGRLPNGDDIPWERLPVSCIVAISSPRSIVLTSPQEPQW